MDVIEVRTGQAERLPEWLRTRALAVTVAAMSAAAVLVGLIVRGLAVRQSLDLGDTATNMLQPIPAALTFSACGAFLWGFHDARPVAKLMLVTGGIAGLGVLGQGLQGVVNVSGTVVGDVGNVVATIGLVLALVLLPQVFPDGLLPGKAWTLVAWMSTAVAVGSILNVVVVSLVADDAEWPWTVLGLAVTAGALTGVVTLAVRWRFATEVVKGQILGFALVSLVPVAVLGVGSLPGLQDINSDSVTMWWPVATVVMVTVAAVRHDLYGIRSSVHRVAVFTAAAVALSVVFAAVYLAVFDLMAGSSGGERLRWPAVLVAATAILLLDPIRRRLTTGAQRRLLGHRTEVLTSLTQLSKTPTQDALAAIVNTVAVAVRSPGVTMSALDQAGAGVVAEFGNPNLPSVAVPLEFEAERLGQLDVAPRTPGEPFQDSDWEMLRLLAQQAAIQLYLARHESDLARSRQEIEERDLQLRAQIGRDLHDGLAPLLAGAGLTADALRLGMAPGSIDARDASRLSDQLRVATSQVRQIARTLQPVVLTEGLATAIAEFVNRLEGPGTPPVALTMDVGELSADVAESAYLIVLEAINNALRHGHPAHLWVSLCQRDTDLEIRVSDDGDGITQPYASGLGVSSMRRRAAASGGHLQLSPRPTGGAELTVVLRCGS